MIRALSFSLALFGSTACWGLSFGTYDARTFAMGGTGVALGDVNSGHFYNPALTAFHEGDEDKTRDGRHNLSALTQFSTAAETAATAIADDIEGRLSDAVAAYNANPNNTAALEAGETAARELRNALGDLVGEDLYGDAYVGYSVSEPGDLEGGAFFIGTRITGGGVADIREEDIDLTTDYIEALQDLQNPGGPQRHPELFDGNGQLINPNTLIQSSADARGLIISEIGVSVAKRFQLQGYDLALGISPKVMQIMTFDDQWRTSGGTFDSSGTQQIDFFMNFDVGIAIPVTENLRAGVAIKDLLPKSYSTQLGNKVQLEPRARFGVAYDRKFFRLGMDFDLTSNKQPYGELLRQELTLGAEFSLYSLAHLRLGYRSDIEGNFGNGFTGGIGGKFGFMSFDFAYSQTDGEAGYGLRLSIAH